MTQVVRVLSRRAQARFDVKIAISDPRTARIFGNTALLADTLSAELHCDEEDAGNGLQSSADPASAIQRSLI
jgi:hypothetical protein